MGAGSRRAASSFGDELRRERELRDISLREISEATKINMRFLEALEGNDFAHLPGGVFNKGFVRAYCEFIGVDAESMVNAYLLEERAQTAGAVDPGTPALLRRTPAAAPRPERPKRGRNIVWIALALLLLAASAAGAWYAGLLDRWLPRPGAAAGTEWTP
jgi:cytoskeleton protein RodZ